MRHGALVCVSSRLAGLRPLQTCQVRIIDIYGSFISSSHAALSFLGICSFDRKFVATLSGHSPET